MVKKKADKKVKDVRLGEILSESIKKSRDSFKEIFKVGFKFYFLPFLILSLIGVLSFGKKFYFLEEGEVPSTALSIFSSIDGIIIFILGILFTIYLIYFFGAKNKDSFGKSKKRLLGSILFIIVMILILGLLFMALVLPGIIFGIFWILAFTIFILEKKGIFESLGKSFDMIRGRWWRTWGYIVILILVVFLIMIPFGIIVYIIDLFVGGGWVLNLWLYVRGAISFLLDFIIAIFTTAFVVEYYLGLKKMKK
jgi:hypothetical protein